MTAFRFPGGDARTTVIGATGTGKTTCGVWLLSRQRFDKRPWIIVDFKLEQIFDAVGMPPIVPWKVTAKPPREAGKLYLVTPRPDQDDELEAFLWRVWERGNCGLFVDEATLMPDRDAFRAILQQGRSKRIPVIACTQRPVDVKRALFSEASYFCVYRLQDRRDARVIEGFVPGDLTAPLPGPHAWRWYDVARNQALVMGAVPSPADVAADLRGRLPLTLHPFAWGTTAGRQSTGRVRMV
jgi:DNA helicase HerA-like ATPase